MSLTVGGVAVVLPVQASGVTPPVSSAATLSLKRRSGLPVAKLRLCPVRSSSRRAQLGTVRAVAEPQVKEAESASPAAPAEEKAAPAAVPIERTPAHSPAVVDINAIKDILPHRFPFLLVDRVVEYIPGVSVVGIKNVTINDNFFPGHFPERPIMPGVLIVEAMAQTGGILMLNPEVGGSRESFFFAGKFYACAQFRKPVVPGDQLRMKVTLGKVNKRFGIAKMRGEAFVDGELVCDADMLMALGKS
eukprot:jgi/Chlat1/5187/Chrsp33S08971